MNGINFLGTSGQNIRDMLLISEVPLGPQASEADKCLFRMKQTLEMRHLCPTAPDTLRVYPFKDHDPFILESCKHNAQLDLGDEEPADSSKTTEVPNVFFTGTMQSFGEQTLWQNDKFVKLISIPSFQVTNSIVLLDLETMDTYQLAFSLSNEICQLGQQLGGMMDDPAANQDTHEIQRDMIID
jgi:DNA polymerase delta subunit 2